MKMCILNWELSLGCGSKHVTLIKIKSFNHKGPRKKFPDSPVDSKSKEIILLKCHVYHSHTIDIVEEEEDDNDLVYSLLSGRILDMLITVTCIREGTIVMLPLLI